MARGAHRPADAVDDVLDGAAAVELARERLHEARAVSRDDAVPHLVRVRVSVRAGSGYGVRARVRARDRARVKARGRARAGYRGPHRDGREEVRVHADPHGRVPRRTHVVPSVRPRGRRGVVR